MWSFEGHLDAYNNTIVGCEVGLKILDGTFLAKNNIIYSCSNPAVGTFEPGTDYNATDNPSLGYVVSGGGNLNDLTNQSFDFLDPQSNDFHLTDSDTGAKDRGTQQVQLLFSNDIDGQERVTPWDIGADEFVSSP